MFGLNIIDICLHYAHLYYRAWAWAGQLTSAATDLSNTGKEQNLTLPGFDSTMT